MNFPEKLSNLRKEHNLSQESFSEIMRVSRQAVSKWESGQSFPDIDKLIDISNFFHVSIDNLVKDDEFEAEERLTDGREPEPDNAFVDAGKPESDDSYKKSKMKRMVISGLSTMCICICLSALMRVDEIQSKYKASILVIYCIVGIAASLYVTVKLKRKVAK